MVDHDRLFKELLTTFFVEFVDLFFEDVSGYLDRNSISFLDKELFTDVTAGEQFEADIVAKVRFLDRDTYFLVHIENQSSCEAGFDFRMYRYFARLYEKFRLPVYPIVVYSFNEPLRAAPNIHRVEFPGFTVLEFHYRVLQLNRLNWRDYLRQENPVAGALMAKMRIAPGERPRVKLECLRLLATLRLDPARMKMISGFVDIYLKLSAEEERLFAMELATIGPGDREGVVEIVTSWMEEGIARGREEGIARGREEGLIQGKQEEALILVQRLLNRRLGQLDTEILERVRTLSVAELEALSEALLDFHELAALITWLDQK
ncbi:Rpn family recombination-promoting nuclease/putative transposase [Gloeobacter morelensis]|uniref:DUF4351 domain-containing protein n=1 Tax=Gloeobacter morelensis MG652769 TaxID=2781736 RepID=A0ABY3PIK4_9CYAN|nr:Rpn family recombination-promoting nuclease/putative transposase [Gloeobacter morelensis]UFP93485.1 DUF4351 domain-containing protein [Gloeobacter morelensis MG652769]